MFDNNMWFPGVFDVYVSFYKYKSKRDVVNCIIVFEPSHKTLNLIRKWVITTEEPTRPIERSNLPKVQPHSCPGGIR